MLKTNVIRKAYRLTLRGPGGTEQVRTVDAESAQAARMKYRCSEGWAVERVEEL